MFFLFSIFSTARGDHQPQLLENKFQIQVPPPEYVGGGEAELAGDVVQRRDHQVVKVRAPRPGREKEA